MNTTILSIGDELVLGQTVDTNAAWLSAQLATIGVAVRAHITVPDHQPSIERAIRESAEVSDVLIASGGLGPTQDDLTRQALATVMGAELVLDVPWFEEMERYFTSRGRTMPAANRIQAMIPVGAHPIFNTAGTAAGLHAELRRAQGACRVFIMPGVPREMKTMFVRDILPALRGAGAGAILSRTLHTFGLGESAIAEKLGDLMDRHRNPSVGTTVSGGVVSLRINARFDDHDEAQRQLDATARACREVLGDLCYGEDDQTLASVVTDLLREKDCRVATAESCTGGLLAQSLTDLPGSGTIFEYGWVTYSNTAKCQLLGVSDALLLEHGAVSIPVVRVMAEGARQRSGSDYALAISGIAGPDGGTEAKPVGTVCIALSAPGEGFAHRFQFIGDRAMIRQRSAKMALALLRYALLGKSIPPALL